MLFLYYPKCSTCQKAKKWLDANHISYEERHIVEENPTYEELKQWYEKGDLPLKKFFNTSGMLYKEQKLKDKPNLRGRAWARGINRRCRIPRLNASPLHGRSAAPRG